MHQVQTAHATDGVGSWLASLSPVLEAAIFTGVVALVALTVQTRVNLLQNRSQRALDRERFEYEKAADERRWLHEREAEERAEGREIQGVALPLRVIILAIVECCQPVYVRGSIAYEAWDRFNNKLHDRLERDDVAERLGSGYATLWEFHDQTVSARNFILPIVTDKEKLAAHLPPDGDAFPLLRSWLRKLFYYAADALDALGDHEAAKVIREREQEALARDMARDV
jgi:hypothetical protein